MGETLKLNFNVDGGDFVSCGQASEGVKRALKSIGIAPQIIRKVAISMYEGEVNMVIHGGGGTAEAEISSEKIFITLRDSGKGIENIELAMSEGFSTADDEIRSLGFGAGMGLPNMKKYSDEIKVESTIGIGTSVYLTFYLN